MHVTQMLVLVVWLVIHDAANLAQGEAVLFVSPKGNDAWSGRTAIPAKDGSDGPLATLHKAVELTHAENCRLVGLEIKNVGGQGIRAWNLKSCAIGGCRVHDTGACGLKFGGECVVRNYLDEQAEDCLVEDNLSLRVARPSHNHMARKNTIGTTLPLRSQSCNLLS